MSAKTDLALVGRKALMRWRDQTAVVSILALDTTYPDTAYSVEWMREDNPDFNFEAAYERHMHYPMPPAPGLMSIAHCSQILEVLK